jgi:hypothetical protein
MLDRLFEAALDIASPRSVSGVRFDEASKVLTLAIDFAAGSRFVLEAVPGEHAVYDTLTNRYRHLNFFQHECVLEVRTPRVDMRDAPHTGPCTNAFEKRTPRAASASKCGVCRWGWPAQDR